MKLHPSMKSKRIQRIAGSAAGAALPLAMALMATLETAHAQRVYSEDFESLSLGPKVEEALAGAQVWTKTPPSGWLIDDSKMPGVGNPAQDGITEWAGWSFASKDWWIAAAGNQRRLEYTLGRGTVMIADPDEWDDSTHLQGLFESTIRTAPIAITNAPADSLVLVYDSSWRPESLDDGLPNFPVDAEGNRINDQTGFITAAFDGAVEAEIQRWSSINGDPTYHDHMPNESVVVPLGNPAGAHNVVLKFGMEKAANDWWWAVDNLAIGIPPFLSGISADGVSFTVRIVEALGKAVDQSKPITVALDGTPVTPVSPSQEGSYLLLTYSQAPVVFQPGSTHTVLVQYTTSDGTARSESTTFVAPSYTSIASTPTIVTATINEPEWLALDESKPVQLKLDGQAVTAASVTRTDVAQVVVRYVQATPFVADSIHQLQVTFTTTGNQALTDSVDFKAPAWITLPANLATAVGSASQPGLKWRTHQLETARANTLAELEAQLAGSLGPSVHDTAGQEADGFYLLDFVNLDQNGGDAGQFTSAAAPPQDVMDGFIPGIPGLTGSTDYIGAEARTFIEFTQTGMYTMVVNSDDGFQVSAGTTNHPTQLVLGLFDGGRSAADTEFYFHVAQTGVYFFRLIWMEGGSDARVEWFTVNADGSRALVGGTQPGALQAYRTRTVPEPTAGQITSWSIVDGKLVLQYTGTLKSSANVSGPFQPVDGSSSPQSVTPTGSQLFFIAE